MAGSFKVVRQLYSARPPPPESIKEVYPVGNGNVYLQIDRQTDRRGYCETIDVSITDDVSLKGGADGYAKYDLRMISHKVKGTRWVLTSHFGGNFSSKGTNSVKDLPEEREWHFYGGSNKLRGCFYLKMDEDSPTWAVAQLQFGLDSGMVHSLTVKITSRGSNILTDIEGPTIMNRNQLKKLAKMLSYIDSKTKDDLEEAECAPEKPVKPAGPNHFLSH